jgi:hypothetical protein
LLQRCHGLEEGTRGSDAADPEGGVSFLLYDFDYRLFDTVPKDCSVIGRLSSTFGKNLFSANDELRLAIVLHGIGDGLVSEEMRVISVERDHNELKGREAGVLTAVQTLNAN